MWIALAKVDKHDSPKLELKIMLKLRGLLFLILFSGAAFAQDEATNYYWIEFTDKNGTNFSVYQPEKYLSQRAIERRQKQNITIDESDLPVSPIYLEALSAKGAEIIHSSKWLNGATVKTSSSGYQKIISTFDFIRFSEMTKPGISLKSTTNKFKIENQWNEIDEAAYGSSIHQLKLLNGQALHSRGFLGEGMLIAVLDAGFHKADELPALEQLSSENRILKTRDFVNPGGNVYLEDSHGTNVLSTMAGHLNGQLIGTAPKASYFLLRSEDDATEYLIEEDNWVAAAEFADSAGCDIINSSLGYTVFDDEKMNHSYTDLDGNSTRVTQAANMAVAKGMMVFSSAGNEAASPWKYLVAPSDGKLVIGVGAVRKDSIWAPFSSLGPAADGATKPNLVAVGWGTILQKTNGNIGPSNGTSFSSPVLAGMAACLWQANPEASSLQIKEALEKSASQYTNPDDTLGFGIPDFETADQLLSEYSSTPIAQNWLAVPNPFLDHVFLYQQSPKLSEKFTVSLFSMNGSLLHQQVLHHQQSFFLSNLANLPAGLILAKIASDTDVSVIKLIKVNP